MLGNHFRDTGSSAPFYGYNPSKTGSRGCLMHGIDDCLQMAHGGRHGSKLLKLVAPMTQYELIRYL